MAENYLKVGYNFTYELLNFLITINNSSYSNKVYEVYGSCAENSFLSARPIYRLPNINRQELKGHITKLKKFGINFNFTLNAYSLGSKKEIIDNENTIKNYIYFLIDSGVETFTISVPLIAEYIRSISNDIGIEVSTIAHIDTITQVKLWKEYYNINKICGNLYKNRDIKFLKKLSDYCEKNDIIISLLANEFCVNGVMSSENCFTSATNCIFRDHCYQLHSLGYGVNEKLINDYPMGKCIDSRSVESIWLKSNFIRPEDMKLYNEIGINHFKLTGRTASTDFIKHLVTSYMEESFEGNLLELWKHLETINPSSKKEFFIPYSIPNKMLDGFLNFWFNNENHLCSNEVCGETCKFCDNYYLNLIKLSKEDLNL